MNNYEHIMQGGINALLDRDDLLCNGCVYSKVPCDHERHTCRAGKLKWLESEYAEPELPDSQERLNEDAKKLECAYLPNANREGYCAECPYDSRSCQAAMNNDLLARQRRLDGMES